MQDTNSTYSITRDARDGLALRVFLHTNHTRLQPLVSEEFSYWFYFGSKRGVDLTQPLGFKWPQPVFHDHDDIRATVCQMMNIGFSPFQASAIPCGYSQLMVLLFRIWATIRGAVINNSITPHTLQFRPQSMYCNQLIVRGRQCHMEMVLGDFYLQGHDRRMMNNGVVENWTSHKVL